MGYTSLGGTDDTHPNPALLRRGDGEDDALAQALEQFNALRHERAGNAQLVARRMGHELYHPEGEGAHLRNAMLASLTQEAMYSKVSWLHGDRSFTDSGHGGHR